MIPDSYIDIPAEKMRIYKQLDSISNEKELDRFAMNLEDRFGKMPEELENLFYVVKIRNMGGHLGFEKIIIKNGLFIAFFISNQMSPYFKTKIFDNILEKISGYGPLYDLKQNEGKLKIVSRGINSMSAAYVT